MRPRTVMTRSSTSAALASLVSAAFAAPAALGADIILNEWNCVGSTKWLGNPGSPVTGCPQPDGPNGATCSSNEDTFFGRLQGNGGDWIELVVIKDHLDLRNWKVQWQEVANTNSNGTDIWNGDGSIPQGTITFLDVAAWSDLRAGTIITLTEKTTALGGLDTDLSFDPCNGDWWINVNLFDTSLVSTLTNIFDPSDPPGYVDPLNVGNDDWQARILDGNGAINIDLVGEGAPGWGGGGVNSREIAKLADNPSTAVNTFSNYKDGDNSSFGSPNSWTDPVTQCTKYQDFSALRGPVLAELCNGCHAVYLNEYNAVKSTLFLNGGTQGVDGNGGQAADTFFGRVLGNGGNWMELVVATDHLDMRGWRLHWQEEFQGTDGSIYLSSNAFWSDVRAGTILTFIEKSTAQGGLDTDLSLNPPGDRWANINTHDAALVAGTTSNQPGHLSGEFTTSNDRWRLEIRNGQDQLVTPWAGEGSPWYYRGRVNSTDICRLRQDATPGVDAAGAYDDANTQSTFGSPNTWADCPSTTVVTQSFASLPSAACVAAPPPVPGDINHDGHVDGADLGLLLAAWGQTGGPGDLNGDGHVDGADLGILLAHWTG